MSEVCREYAEALFLLGVEGSREDEYMQSLNTVKNVFDENSEYLEMLASPVIALQERKDAFLSVFGEILPEQVCSFVLLLCERGRMKEFGECVRQYAKLLRASKSLTAVRVRSAVELTESERVRLCDALERRLGGRVEPEFVTDGSLIGGISVEYDGKVIDLSLKSRLQDIKDVIDI